MPMPTAPTTNPLVVAAAIVAAIYLRISRAADGTTLGVERQLQPAVTLCQRNRWRVPALEQELTVAEILAAIRGGRHVQGIYVDNDLSAARQHGTRKHRKRPDFERLLADAGAGRIGAIAAFDVDRLSRDPDRDNARLIDLAETHGVQLATWTGDYDLQTASGRYAFRIEGARAARESEQKGERLKLKHAELRAAGKWSGGRPPFGYRLDGIKVGGGRLRHCTLVVEEAEAAAIRAAAARILTGGTPSGALKQFIARNGARGGRGGRRRSWNLTMLKAMLTSPRLAGMRECDEQLVAADWPAILTLTELEQLQQLLGHGKPPTVTGRGIVRSYLLTGFLYHAAPGRCHHKLVGKRNQHGKPGYRCEAQHGGCGRLHRQAAPVDDHVRDAVLRALADPKFRSTLERASEQAGARDLQALVAERAVLKARIAGFATALGAGVLDLPGYQIARREAAGQLAEVEAQLGRATDTRARLLAELPGDYQTLRQAWEDADLDRRRAIVGLAVRRVWLCGVKQGTRFRPEHLRIYWRG